MTTTTSPEQSSTRHLSPLLARHARTIAVTARKRSRFARLKVRHPYREHRYDAALASELLGRTCEMPASKHDLLIVIGEYRYALHDLITALTGQSPEAVFSSTLEQARQHDDQPSDPVA